MPSPRMLLFVLVLAALGSSLASADDGAVELGPMKDPFPPSKPKPKPVDPCVATCKDVNAKEKACDKAASACDSAQSEAKKVCKKACDAAARNAQCGEDAECKRIVDDVKQSCRAECDFASYDLSACSEKERICAAYSSARDATTCRC